MAHIEVERFLHLHSIGCLSPDFVGEIHELRLDGVAIPESAEIVEHLQALASAHKAVLADIDRLTAMLAVDQG